MPPLILIVLSRLDRNIQSAMEMLPLKRRRGVAHSFNCTPRALTYMRLADALVSFLLNCLCRWMLSLVRYSSDNSSSWTMTNTMRWFQVTVWLTYLLTYLESKIVDKNCAVEIPQRSAVLLVWPRCHDQASSRRRHAAAAANALRCPHTTPISERKHNTLLSLTPLTSFKPIRNPRIRLQHALILNAEYTVPRHTFCVRIYKIVDNNNRCVHALCLRKAFFNNSNNSDSLSVILVQTVTNDDDDDDDDDDDEFNLHLIIRLRNVI